MSRWLMLAMFTVATFATFAAISEAYADPHKDRFRRECSTSRKCY
ncbi:MAG: hypothetical protein ACRCTD_13325 [Beijerinckiaceae bacterium]